MDTLGQKIAYLRKKKGVSQREFAKVLGLSQSAIAQYERDVTEPDIQTLKRISKFFDVSIDFLVADDEDIVVIRRQKYNKLLDCSKGIAEISEKLIELMKE